MELETHSVSKDTVKESIKLTDSLVGNEGAKNMEPVDVDKEKPNGQMEEIIHNFQNQEKGKDFFHLSGDKDLKNEYGKVGASLVMDLDPSEFILSPKSESEKNEILENKIAKYQGHLSEVLNDGKATAKRWKRIPRDKKANEEKLTET